MKMIQKTHKQTKNLQSTIFNFMSKILSDGKIEEGINSLNLKLREVFSMVHIWVKDHAEHDGYVVQPVHIFLSGIGKSHLVKVINNVMLKTLLYHCKVPEKARALFLEPTVTSTVNVGGTTIHSGLSIKPGTKLLGNTYLNEKSEGFFKK